MRCIESSTSCSVSELANKASSKSIRHIIPQQNQTLFYLPGRARFENKFWWMIFSGGGEPRKSKDTPTPRLISRLPSIERKPDFACAASFMYSTSMVNRAAVSVLDRNGRACATWKERRRGGKIGRKRWELLSSLCSVDRLSRPSSRRSVRGRLTKLKWLSRPIEISKYTK